MKAYELALISAIRDREPGESVLSAFSRFVLDLRGLLASKEPEAAEQLAAITASSPKAPNCSRANASSSRNTRTPWPP
jgi:hypothetical protein